MRALWLLTLVGVLLTQQASGLRSKYVCTETFRAGLTSFFTTADTKAAFAEDQNELCDLCAKVTRLAFLYTNDVQTQSKWAQSLESSACTYVGSARRRDCQKLTGEIVQAQRSFFEGKKSKFTTKELHGTTEQLGMLVDSRSYDMCRDMGCCAIVPKRKGRKVLKPCSRPGDVADVTKDREALQKDRFYLDKIKEELFDQRRLNNAFKAKLDLKEIDIQSRENKLKKDLEVLRKDQEKLREAKDALKRREARVQRRERDEKDREEHNKKHESWLKKREELVGDREAICWKREDQLGLPHPPTNRPAGPPPAPPAVPRPPSNS